MVAGPSAAVPPAHTAVVTRAAGQKIPSDSDMVANANLMRYQRVQLDIIC